MKEIFLTVLCLTVGCSYLSVNCTPIFLDIQKFFSRPVPAYVQPQAATTHYQPMVNSQMTDIFGKFISILSNKWGGGYKNVNFGYGGGATRRPHRSSTTTTTEADTVFFPSINVTVEAGVSSAVVGSAPAMGAMPSVSPDMNMGGGALMPSSNSAVTQSMSPQGAAPPSQPMPAPASAQAMPLDMTGIMAQPMQPGMMTQPMQPGMVGMTAQPMQPGMTGLMTQPMQPGMTGMMAQPMQPGMTGMMVEPSPVTASSPNTIGVISVRAGVSQMPMQQNAAAASAAAPQVPAQGAVPPAQQMPLQSSASQGMMSGGLQPSAAGGQPPAVLPAVSPQGTGSQSAELQVFGLQNKAQQAPGSLIASPPVLFQPPPGSPPSGSISPSPLSPGPPSPGSPSPAPPSPGPLSPGLQQASPQSANSAPAGQQGVSSQVAGQPPSSAATSPQAQIPAASHSATIPLAGTSSVAQLRTGLLSTRSGFSDQGYESGSLSLTPEDLGNQSEDQFNDYDAETYSYPKSSSITRLLPVSKQEYNPSYGGAVSDFNFIGGSQSNYQSDDQSAFIDPTSLSGLHNGLVSLSQHAATDDISYSPDSNYYSNLEDSGNDYGLKARYSLSRRKGLTPSYKYTTTDNYQEVGGDFSYSANDNDYELSANSRRESGLNNLRKKYVLAYKQTSTPNYESSSTLNYNEDEAGSVQIDDNSGLTQGGSSRQNALRKKFKLGYKKSTTPSYEVSSTDDYSTRGPTKNVILVYNDGSEETSSSEYSNNTEGTYEDNVTETTRKAKLKKKYVKRKRVRV